MDLHKKQTLLFIFFLVILTFVGCGESTADAVPDITISDGNGKILDGVYEVVEGEGFKYYCDPITGGMFLWKSSSGYRGGLTQMLDPESGKPLTYEKFLEYYDAYMETTSE